MEKQENIRVAIVEDNYELRKLLSEVLDASEGISCVATFVNGTAFVNAAETLEADVILMDINMPGMSLHSFTSKDFDCGIGLTPNDRELVLFSNDQFIYKRPFFREDDDKIFDSILAGATGYILKKTPADKIVEAIRDIYTGGSPMSGQIARKVLDAYQAKSKATANAIESLSLRERELLSYLADGFRYKEIADKMFISLDTVRKHIHNIYGKLHVNSRTEALNKLFPKG